MPDIGPQDFGPLVVSSYCSPVSIHTLPEGPPGHIEKLLNISTKFRKNFLYPMLLFTTAQGRFS